ncbi:MAG: T9SS type A sorting domain-containing protein [Candidatus Omnitrophica bacterium]|nr:T9SS type A sorting domain-containing protein [Candidatus Omnitrophota bacterium]
MFFKNLFLVIVLMSLSSLSFGQPVCGWNRVDSTSPTTIKTDLHPDWFVDKGKIEISNEHGPNGGRKSLKFFDIDGSADFKGIICWWKAYNLSVGKSFSICFDVSTFYSSTEGSIRFRVISRGKIFETPLRYYGCGWTNPLDDYFTPINNNCDTCLGIDTLVIFFRSNHATKPPFGIYIDNFAIKIPGFGAVMFDSCGEEQAVEEKSVISNLESVKIFPNPFALSCHFQGATKQIVIYDVSGKKVKTLKEPNWNGKDELERQLPNGIYFAKTLIGDKTVTKKLTLLK